MAFAFIITFPDPFGNDGLEPCRDELGVGGAAVNSTDGLFGVFSFIDWSENSTCCFPLSLTCRKYVYATLELILSYTDTMTSGTCMNRVS